MDLQNNNQIEDELYYQKKYLKYKLKYLALKDEYEGGNIVKDFKEANRTDFTGKIRDAINDAFVNMPKDMKLKLFNTSNFFKSHNMDILKLFKIEYDIKKPDFKSHTTLRNLLTNVSIQAVDKKYIDRSKKDELKNYILDAVNKHYPK
jgi:hypothetical protein